MFDFLRNLRKSKAEKRQEAITAYLDDALTAGERRRLERQMSVDPDLRADMEQQRLIKVNISRLPRARAPRNFTLDPALYGRPASQNSARLYPALRVATVLIGVFFVISIGAEIFSGSGLPFESFSDADQNFALAPAADLMLESEAEMAMPAEEPAALEPGPQTGNEAEAAIAEAEESVEEEQFEEAPAEALGMVTDEDSAEESLTEIVGTRVVDTATEKVGTVVAEAESAPRAGAAEQEQAEVAEAPPAEPDDGQAGLPSDGGGEPEESPLSSVLATEVAGRSDPTATEIATSQPTATMAPILPGEILADALEAPDAEAPRATVSEGEPIERVDRSAGLSPLRVAILLLGITLVLLAAVTLFTRWQLKR